MDNKVEVFKAQVTGDQEIPDLEITAREPVPQINRDAPERFYRPGYDGVFLSDATKIVDALTRSLPGGTLDRVLAILLQRKASIYVIREKEMMRIP